MNSIQLETRQCDCKCGESFRVMPGSKSRYVSELHEATDTPGGANWRNMKSRQKTPKPKKPRTVLATGTAAPGVPLRVSKKRERLNAVTKENGIEIRSRKPKEELQDVLPINRTRKLAEQRDESIGQTEVPSNEKKIVKNESNGAGKIVNTQDQPGTNGTDKTVSIIASNKQSEELNETLPMVSTEQFLTSAMVRSPSMNLLDDLGGQLFGSMKKLSDGKDLRPIQEQTEAMHAMCNAAKNIREIMKLKLDAMKLQHEINKETGAYKNQGANT